MSKLVVTMVPTQYIYHVWYEVEAILEKAVENSFGRYTTNDIYRECLAQKQTLWIVKDQALDKIIGVVTTSINQYPQKKYLSGIFASGERSIEWVYELMRVLDIFGKENNCDGFEIIGREGWVKRLKHLGMKKLFTTMQKEY